jgi:hypothetical protein
MNFAIANPAHQVFFTVVEREAKYKAKNLIDVVIYRGSEALYVPWRHRTVCAASGRRMARVRQPFWPPRKGGEGACHPYGH